MQLSLFDQLIIAIDDATELRLVAIAALFPTTQLRILSAALGKLISRGWVTKVADDPQTFRVSETGNRAINQVLGSIRRRDETWPGSWFCAAVTLPESERKRRDALRHYFIGQGYGRLLDGLWISPWNRQAELSEILRQLETGAHVFVFRTENLGPATNVLIIQQAWPWHEIEARWRAFLDMAAKEVGEAERLAQLSGGQTRPNQRRLQAKKFVFAYGRELERSPNLPWSVSPIEKLERQAHAFYEKVRPSCYN